MRRSSRGITIAVGAGVIGVAVTASGAEARLDLYVDKSTQQLSVIQNGALVYVWPVSTGRDRFSTPSGVYTPERLERSWFSKAYYNSPMPHAIFFHGGYAIHGSYDISKLGGPASHGCVRLHPRNAGLLFSMVERAGPGNTAIFVGGNSHRPSLRYHNFDDPTLPAWRPEDGLTRSPYPPLPVPAIPPGGDRYVDGAHPPPPSAPPPSGLRPPPSPSERTADGRGSYPAGPDAAPYYQADRYGGGRSVPRGPDVGPYRGAPDRYADERDAPHGPGVPPDYYADPRVDGRVAARDPRIPPDYTVAPRVDGRGAAYDPRIPQDYQDYNVDPYVDGGRGAPYGVPPYYPPDPRGDGRDPNPQREHGPRMPPYNAVDAYPEGPGRRQSDQLATRGHSPANRLPAPRPNGEALADRTPRNGFQPPTAGAKPDKPGRIADQPPGRHVTPAGETARAQPLPPPPPPPPQPAVATSPPPTPAARVEPPQEHRQPDLGYKVLPKSYWAGASWRWRLKRDDDGPHDPQ
jgi:L,D-transpeptidase catalytic domain